MEKIASHLVFGGQQIVAKHASSTCKCDMTFAVYLPPQAEVENVPVMWWLSGLTCTHENGMVKGGLQQYAAKYGIAIVYPDTSPRGETIANDESFAMGQGAGFYVDATEAPWAEHFQMYSYITRELPALIEAEFPQIDMSRQCISGHSMGGHGALMIGMRNPNVFKSVSAFAPMTSVSTNDEWGVTQLSQYLGSDETKWADYDAAKLAKSYDRELLVDQGTSDPYVELLQPQKLVDAGVNVRFREGYDHSYFFVTTFADDHFAWHKSKLSR